MEGDYLWLMKDYIDRSFMRKYSEDLPAMGDAHHDPALQAAQFSGADAQAALAGTQRMRCGGCGAKVTSAA